MLIIVDGPDGSGKSTLVSRISEYVRAVYPGDEVTVIHKSPPTGHPLAEYVEPLLGYRPGQHHHVVCDRWHWGEMVYPDVLSRPTEMDRAVWRYTEMFLRSRGTIVVFPYVDQKDLEARLRKNGDYLIGLQHVPLMWAAYQKVSNQTLLPVYRYNQAVRDPLPALTLRLQPGSVVAGIVSQAIAYEAAAVPLNQFQTYVGPPRPEYLLVGDERPPKMDRDFPAFMPYAPNSGHYLLSALRGPRLTNVALINANDVDDAVLAWHVLGRPKVLALGAKAYREFSGVSAQLGRVPHPQFVRRFYQRHQGEYGLAVDEAMTYGRDLSSWRPANPSWSPMPRVGRR